MRIVGGSLGGRRLTTAAGQVTRPTAERVREGLASALESRAAIEGAIVLDLFAGSGALSFEALSRGAAVAVLADHDRRALRAIQANVASLGLTDRAAILDVDLLGAPAPVVARLRQALGHLRPGGGEVGDQFDLIFADPPYKDAAEISGLLSFLMAGALIADGAYVAIEHGRGPTGRRQVHGDAPPGIEMPNGLASVATYRYGDTAVVLAHKETQGERAS